MAAKSPAEIHSLHSGETEAVVIVKAAPQVGQRHGETVCCAGIDLQGHWLRLYPVSFRTLEEGQKFRRWDRIQFRWRRSTEDSRTESRRVDHNSIRIVGKLKKPFERQRFLGGTIVTSLEHERAAGRSLALLKAKILGFKIDKKPDAELELETKRFAALRAQEDLFNTKPIIPYEPCPYQFKYRYQTDDGLREGTCQDWEIEATFFKWSKQYGEERALEDMRRRFGEEYPQKGMLLAMGTHSRYPDTWLINGVIRLDEIEQLSLF
jgi:hypothetical protein